MAVGQRVASADASEGAIPAPPHYGIGSIEEAFCCAAELRSAFQATPGAVEWITAESQQAPLDVDRHPAAGRRGAKKRGRK